MGKLQLASEAMREALLNLNLATDENDLVTNMVIKQLMDEAARITNHLEELISNLSIDRSLK